MFFFGPHRKLAGDLDAVIIASVSDFKRVKLTGADLRRAAGRPTPEAPSKAGSAFLTKPFTLTPGTGFESGFGFRTGGVNGAGTQGSDGFASVLQADLRGANAIGNAGGGLGYGNNPTFGNTVSPVTPSLAGALDTHGNSFDPDGNHVEFVFNGDVANPPNTFAPIMLNGGQQYFAWVDYDPLQDLPSLFPADDDTKPVSPVLSRVVSLADFWGRDVPQ